MNTLAHEQAYRGEKLIKRMAEQPIVVCSAGAIGSNLVDNMVRQGFGKISCIDFDRIEDHNRHTQIWTKRDLGLHKVVVLHNRMFDVRGVTVVPVPVKLEASNIKKLLPKGSLVVDGFDNVPSRALVMQYCKDNGIDCLHIGLSKDYAEVTWNEIYRLPSEPKGQDVCEYPLARNIALMAITIGTEVIIRYVSKGVKESYEVSLGDFKVTRRL